jgi:hypothetical protein
VSESTTRKRTLPQLPLEGEAVSLGPVPIGAAIDEENGVGPGAHPDSIYEKRPSVN